MVAPASKRRWVISLAAVLIVLGLNACGGSGPPGFTAGRAPPTQPSEFTTIRPTQEMADETEALITDREKGVFASPECAPADSLEGVGEFNFDCTAKDLRRAEWFKLDVVVMGTESREPKLGPVIEYTRRVPLRQP